MSRVMSGAIDIARVNRLHKTSAGRKLLNTEVAYASGCVQLVAITGGSLERIQSVVSRMACEAHAPIDRVPLHILELIQNSWRVEAAPLSERWRFEREYPSECGNGCRAKFYSYLEEESNR